VKEMTRVVELPADSVIAKLYDHAALADAFAITLPDDIDLDIEQIAQAILGTPSWWFRLLLACRDALVALFGIKTSIQLREEIELAAMPHIHFFPIVSRTPAEVVVGTDEKHLRFRTSVLLSRNPLIRRNEVVVTTVVHNLNRLGNVYLMMIAPFHRLVVRSNLQRAASRGWK
jgi:hypothetical protein